jgi:RHS repeat-associated protein
LKNYGYDDAFRITGITDAGSSALSWSYGYDNLDRLNSASKTGTTQGWTYDANGNRLSETGSAPSAYTNSAASNRVSSISGSLVRTYGYDAAGNTLSYAGITFTYNNRGRMATATNGSATAAYTYNALGQRIKRTASGVTTLYVYDEAGHLAGEYTSTGALIQETVWLGDMPVATLRPNGSGGVILYYVHTDHLNTPRLVTDTSNNIRWRWDSDPFGTTAPDENPSSLGVFTYNLRFPGQQYDSVAGLNYNYYRDLDPATGRYVQSDPIGLFGGLNTYSYVDGNPLSALDPLGLAHCWPTWHRYKDFQSENLKDPLPQYSQEYKSFRPGPGVKAGPGYSLPKPGNEGGLNMGAKIEWEMWDVVDKTEKHVNGYRHRFRWVTEYICEEVGPCGETRRWSEVREGAWNPWRQMIVDMTETKETLWLRRVGSIWLGIGSTPSIPRR